MEIIKKAWKISVNDLEEPYYYEDVIVHAETRDKARSLGLTEMLNLGAGKYSTAEAFKIVKGSDYSRQEKVILLDKSYNLDIDSRIEEFKKKIETLKNKKI